jgi:ribose transport system permease protein
MSSDTKATAKDGRSNIKHTKPTGLGLQGLMKYALLAMLLLEVCVFSLLAPSEFGTFANLRATLLGEPALGILTLAVLIPLIAGEFDVSLAAVFTTAMLVAGSLIASTSLPLMAALAAAVAISALIGAVTGFLVVITRANSLIVSLGMMILLRGFAEALTEGSTINVRSESADSLRLFSSGLLYGFGPVLCLAAVALLVWYTTEMTPLGRRWHAVGGSPEGARLLGLNTDALRIGAFAAGGGLAGLAGIVQLSGSLAATPSFGSGFLFPAIAAAFLGAAGFRIGTFNVMGSLVAIFVLSVGVTGIKTLGAPNWIDGVFYGGALIAAVAIVRSGLGGKS